MAVSVDIAVDFIVHHIDRNGPTHSDAHTAGVLASAHPD